MRVGIAALAGCLVVLAAAAAQAREDAPEFEFHKKGEVAAIRVVIPPAWVPEGARATLRPGDAAVYLVWPDPAEVPAGKDATRWETAFVGRFQGSGSHPMHLTVVAPDGRRTERDLAVNLPDGDMARPSVLAAWAEAGARAVSGPTGDATDPFLSFLRWSWSSRSRERPPGRPARQSFLPAREPPDLLSVSTGLYAVQESLQLAALSSPGLRDRAQPDVPVSSLLGPLIKSHPYKDMLRGKKPVADDLARFVPADRWYLRVAGLAKLANLARTADDWLTHFARTTTDASVDARAVPRLLIQMGLTEDGLRDPGLVASVREVALLGTDPFLREGTSACAVIVPADAPALDRALDAQWAAIRASEPAAETQEVGPPKVRGLVSPDRTVNSWRFTLEGRTVVCNSLPLAMEVLAARSGKAATLADADDFKYMRTVLPAEGEDAFLYLSDAFVRQLVSARTKLAERRRLLCASTLETENHAADLFRMELRRAPKNLAEVMAAGFLPADAPWCPDGGRHEIDPASQAARCSLHGRVGALKPLNELALARVTKEEAGLYQEFVADYQTYWKRYFDPIGVRAKLDHGLTIETVILPLIDNSVYNFLKSMTDGPGARVANVTVPPKTIFFAQAELAKDALDNAMGAEAVREVAHKLGLGDIRGVFGPDVTFGLYDRDLLFDFDVHEFLSMTLRDRLGVDGVVLLPVLAALNLPTFVTVGVRDQAKLDRLLAAARSAVEEVAAKAAEAAERRGMDLFQADSYDLPEYKGTPVHVFGAKLLGIVKWRIFYAIKGGRLLAASKEYVLRDLLDAAPGIDPGETGGERVSLRLLLDRRAFDRILSDVHLSWAEHARRACMANIPGVWASMLASGGKAPAEALRWALARRGHTFACPDGGDYVADADGAISCTVHGSPWAQKQGQAPNVLPRAEAFLERLGTIAVNLLFTPEGLRTKIRIEAM